jgi:hypothetical protein
VGFWIHTRKVLIGLHIARQRKDYRACKYRINACGSECESNDGLVINEQNGISNATYISKLLDAAHATQPDIIYSTVTMAQFTRNPLQENWTGVKRILRYLKGTMDFALTCEEQEGV